MFSLIRSKNKHKQSNSAQEKKQSGDVEINSLIQLQQIIGNQQVMRMMSDNIIKDENQTEKEDIEDENTDVKYIIEEMKKSKSPHLTWKTLVKEFSSKNSSQDTLEKAEKILIQEANKLKQTFSSIIYGKNPLTITDGNNILEIIDEGNAEDLDGDYLSQNKAFTFEEESVENEWGLGQLKIPTEEVIIIKGDQTGVSWGPYLSMVVPLAHSHPYFKKGKPRDHKGISLKTKQIAQHGKLSKGRIPWNDITQNLSNDASREMLKIFPSAGDIKFCAEQKVSQHTVFTPYCGITYKENLLITNPQNTRPDAPRLRFEILNAKPLDEDGYYTCTLQAWLIKSEVKNDSDNEESNDNEESKYPNDEISIKDKIWEKTVTANTSLGGSQFGTLSWK